MSQHTPDKFPITEKTAKEFDIVLISCNHYHVRYVKIPKTIRTAKDWANYQLDMIQGAINWQPTDIIAHPFYIHKKIKDDNNNIIAVDRADILNEMLLLNRFQDILDDNLERDKSVQFELNSRHFKYDLFNFSFIVGFRSFMPAFGTDAHRLNDIAYTEKDYRMFLSLLRAPI